MIAPYEVAPANLDPVDAQLRRRKVEKALEGVRHLGPPAPRYGAVGVVFVRIARTRTCAAGT